MIAQMKYKILKTTFSIFFSAAIAWVIAETSDVDWLPAFVVLALCMPLAVWLERIKNVPAHFMSAYLMNKELVNETKKKLRKLPLKTANDWNEFQSFYDSDQEISAYTSSDAKAYAVSTRYSLQTIRDCGNFMEFMNSSLVVSKAIEQIYWETADIEQLEFVRSKGYDSWAEYMAEQGSGGDVRESWKAAAAEEKLNRESKIKD